MPEMGNVTARTDTSLSLKQAAEQVGKSKPTLLRAIHKEGGLSATKDQEGQWWIEPAELFRVYQPVSQEAVQASAHDAPRTADEAAALRREMARVEEERERERRQLQETIDDLRRRLDGEAEERRRLTLLLTDQRAKETPPAPEPPRGFLRRLLGGV